MEMPSRRPWIGALTLGATLALALALSDLFNGGHSASAAFVPPTDQNYIAVDCDLGTAGVQTDCTVASGVTSLDVGIVVGNVIVGGPTSVGSYNFELIAPK